MDFKQFREYTFRALNISSDEELIAIVEKNEANQMKTEEHETKKTLVVRQIKQYLDKSEEVRGKEKKKPIALELFDYLLEHLWFCAKERRFTKTALTKLNEFYLEGNLSREEYEKYYLPILKSFPDLASSLPMLPARFESNIQEEVKSSSLPVLPAPSTLPTDSKEQCAAKEQEVLTSAKDTSCIIC